MLLPGPALSAAHRRLALDERAFGRHRLPLAATSRREPARQHAVAALYLFLTYGLMFLGLLLLIRRWLRGRRCPGAAGQRRLTRFEVSAVRAVGGGADLWLLFGGGRWADYGCALRPAVNTLYYAGFAVFAAPQHGMLPSKVPQPAADLAIPGREVGWQSRHESQGL